jgi:eukaryotic-like serine/threonine-protein kinase
MKPLGATDPTVVGSYQILAVLGGGGMGRVYLAQSRTGRRVAIKVIHPDLAENPDFRRRFAREVAAARAVNPLYTAAVVDADTEADAPWLATVFIDGPSLERRVAEGGPLGGPAILTLAACLSEALASIHRSGLVHRDLKPSNVLLTDAGPHIVDFGIALAPDTRTTTDLLMGTPSYMAPERLQGVEGQPAGDIFALGATLYFAATGRNLVNGATAYIKIMQVAEGRFDLLAIPKELRPLITRCVSRRPRDRPTADEIAATLTASGAPPPRTGWYQAPPEAAAADLAPGAPPRITVKRLPPTKWARRRVLTASGVIAAAAVGGVAAALSLDAWWNPSPGPGMLRWQAKSGASEQDQPSGDPYASRIVVDPRGILVATDGSDVVAVDRDGRLLWRERFSGEPPLIRRWGDAILINDSSRVWLLDPQTRDFVFSTTAAQIVHAVSAKTKLDSLPPIGRITIGAQRAFLAIGGFIIAINRQGSALRQYLPPPAHQGLQVKSHHPLGATADWLLTQEVADANAVVSLFEVDSGVRRWSARSYTFDPDPGQPGGAGGRGGPPPSGGPPNDGRDGPGGRDGGPGNDRQWSWSEAHFGTDHVLVRDLRDVRVLSLTDGKQLWTTRLDDPVASVALIEDMVLVSGDGVRAFALTTATLRWQASLRGARLAAPPTPQPATFVVAAADREICGLDRSGHFTWRTSLPPVGRAEDLTVEADTAFVTFNPHDQPPDQHDQPVDIDVAAYRITA